QSGAELLGRLVDAEARAVGGDLEQDATRLAEVDRLEIPAVDHRGHVAAGCQQRVSPPHLGIRVRRPPGDVMNGSDRLFAFRPLRRFDDIEDGVWATLSGLEAGGLA